MKRNIYYLAFILLIAVGCATKETHNNPAHIRFFGSPSAELFTKIIDTSFAGVLTGNYIGPGDTLYPEGFVHASQYPRYWYGTFWTRDGGTFLRELIHFNYLHQAKKVAQCLISLVDKNEDGYYAFPMYFKPKKKEAGSELDGTSSIIIAMIDLWKALDEKDSLKAQVYQFLHQESSPLRFIHHQLGQLPLLPGEGEFGPGCGIPGAANNVVQNYLSSLALLAGSEMEKLSGDKASADLYKKDAQTIQTNMLKYLVDKDSSWIWCINPKSMQPDQVILNDTINEGFGGIQGVSCMYSDVLGLNPLQSGWEGVKCNLKTFDKLYSYPLRKEQFEKYGIWTQFNKLRKGYIMSPSYGQGYATQTMLLYDKLEMAEKAIEGLSEATIHPCPGLTLHRTSSYHIYERYYCPDGAGKTLIDEGCGALNLVNVTEQLKVARMIVGIDDHDLNELKIYPRVPPSWNGYEASNMPVLTSNGTAIITLSYKKLDGKILFSFKTVKGKCFHKISIRLPYKNDWKWFEKSDVENFEIAL